MSRRNLGGPRVVSPVSPSCALYDGIDLAIPDSQPVLPSRESSQITTTIRVTTRLLSMCQKPRSLKWHSWHMSMGMCISRMPGSRFTHAAKRKQTSCCRSLVVANHSADFAPARANRISLPVSFTGAHRHRPRIGVAMFFSWTIFASPISCPLQRSLALGQHSQGGRQRECVCGEKKTQDGEAGIPESTLKPCHLLCPFIPSCIVYFVWQLPWRQ